MSTAIPREFDRALPTTWCVVVCEQARCDESWTVDTADFSPALTAGQVEALLLPLLDAHSIVEHGARW